MRIAAAIVLDQNRHSLNESGLGVMSTERLRECDCLVVGTGPAGLIAALAMAAAGLDTIVAGPPLDPVTAARDTRTTALFTGSVTLLANLSIWPHLAGSAVPLLAIRLIDDTGAIWRAPEVLFRARELDLPAFGANVDNVDLLRALYDRVGEESRLAVVAGNVVAGFETGDGGTIVALDDGRRIAARLVVGADGRNSLCRAEAGIAIRQSPYPQSALATRFAHARDHEGISSELHRPTGPLTTVPLAGRQSSLVWVETPEEADRLEAIGEHDFITTLEERLQGFLGTITSIGPRAAFPLSRMVAERMGARRIALVGEAAHVIPPIGAQGLNLGLRDIAVLAELVGDARTNGDDIGGGKLLAAFDRARRGDVAGRVNMVDALNRSLISGFLPLHLVRGAGLHALDRIGWLRRLVMQEGLQPSGRLPRLMRDDATPAGVVSAAPA